MARRTLLAIAGIGVLLVGTCAVTGTSLVPVQVALGPCLMDWTSPSTYKPRVSPLATVRAPLGDGALELCYSRPIARGRQVFGGLVPYGAPWRLGANEPTRLYVNRPVQLGDVRLEPGRYSLYVTPDSAHWQFHVSRSVLHWGNDISAAVQAREVGRLTVPVEPLAQPVDSFTIRAEPGPGDGLRLVFEWEQTRAALELHPASPDR